MAKTTKQRNPEGDQCYNIYKNQTARLNRMLKLSHNNRFTLNGVNELIISKPSDRSGNITFTMGGKRAHTSTLTMPEFESATGYTVAGLEPESKTPLSDIIEVAERKLLSLDMNVEKENKDFLVQAEIMFSTRSNANMSASFRIAKRENETFRVSIRKRNSYGAMNSNDAEGRNLEILLADIFPQLEGYVASRVQILSAKKTEGKTDREISHDGFHKLFKNESLNKYFDQQNMPAGIVINQKDRYQIFTSYTAFDGKRHLHYQTKDYASLKNAEKALNGFGYDAYGKRLDILNIEDFQEDIRLSLRNKGQSLSWTSATVGEFQTNNGYIEISGIEKAFDEKFGFMWHINMCYTDEKSGNKIAEVVQIDPDQGGHFYANRITKFVADADKVSLSEDPQFDPDARTLKEKLDYHKGRYDYYCERKKHAEGVLKENAYNDSQKSYFSNQIGNFNSLITHHLLKAQEYGKLVQREARDHDLSL